MSSHFGIFVCPDLKKKLIQRLQWKLSENHVFGIFTRVYLAMARTLPGLVPCFLRGAILKISNEFLSFLVPPYLSAFKMLFVRACIFMHRSGAIIIQIRYTPAHNPASWKACHGRMPRRSRWVPAIQGQGHYSDTNYRMFWLVIRQKSGVYVFYFAFNIWCLIAT